MRQVTKAMRIFRELVQKAAERAVFFSDDVTMHFCRQKGEEFPDRLKPGAMILELPEDDQRALKELTSEEVANDIRI